MSFPRAGIAFVGDTLFAIGCGRVIEGNAQMMWASLQKLMALPKETTIYCGHEYTQANARFALTIEPENEALQKRAKEVDALRAAGKPTLPTTLGLELETNPFLRPSSPAIQKRLEHGRQARVADLRRDPRAQEPQLIAKMAVVGLRPIARHTFGDPCRRPSPSRQRR